jgi:ABC-2 type transport system ATP-binding protein
MRDGIIHLKGINGSGKTTFSKIVAGIVPYKGTITLHGKYDPQKTKVKYRKLVNYSEPEAIYPDYLSAYDLLTFVGKAKGASHNDIMSIAEQFGIIEYLYDHTGSYSSGMIKRLSLTLAFLGNPSLIILDEPLNALDSVAIDIVKHMVETSHEKGINFILVSHQELAKVGIPITESFVVEHHTIRPQR